MLELSNRSLELMFQIHIWKS